MNADGVEAYCEFFENLSPETLPHLAEVTTDDIRFKDPFNDITGRDALAALFAHMFEQVGEPQFTVLDRAEGQEGAWYLYWRFTAHVPALGGAWTFDGMSRIELAEDGRVKSHVDYWDAAEHFFGKVPLIGPLLRFVGRRGRAG